jgi:hypothetical protein
MGAALSNAFVLMFLNLCVDLEEVSEFFQGVNVFSPRLLFVVATGSPCRWPLGSLMSSGPTHETPAVLLGH